MSATDSTVESGLVGMQIGIELLVKVSVWNLQYCREWACRNADWYSAVYEG